MPASSSDSVLTTTLRRRELHRRRTLLIGLAVLIVLSTSPVLGHHVVKAVDWLPASRQHLGVFCLVSLHLLLVPVHGLFHWLLGLGFVLAVLDRSRAVWRARAVLRGVTTSPIQPGDGLYEAATLAGVSPDCIQTLRSGTVPAFTAGLLRPRIYVAADLPSRLTVEEMAAVLTHESVHRNRRDPLRLSACRFLATLLFWIPALRRVADDLADDFEIEADSIAAARFPLDLASALVTLAGGPSPRATIDGIVGFESADLLERRVRRLAGFEPPIHSRVSRRSIVGAVIVLAAAWGSGVMVLHPLPDATSNFVGPVHCDQHSGGPLTHLFCRGAVWRWGDDRCPHSGQLAFTHGAT